MSKPEKKFLQGNKACAEAAVRAGCRFFASYPITPANEIANRMVQLLPKVNGVFIQMEDEIASVGAVIGASWAGAKAMTATSGPGLSLMLENIGYAIMTETPCVIVDVQRVGPSTGQATRPAQGDTMQVRWGAHGDYEIIALVPWSVQETYELTIRAFNLSEQYRVPVFLLTDEALAHLEEAIQVPNKVSLFDRIRPPKNKSIAPFGTEEPFGISPMPRFGEGAKLLVTGSTHDRFGYRRTTDPKVQSKLVSRLCNKIRSNRAKIIEIEKYFMDDAQTLVIAYGFTARSAFSAVKLAREQGLRAGLLRLKTLWPFPENELKKLDHQFKRIIVPEMNQGQILREIERCIAGSEIVSLPKTNGEVITPEEIVELIKK